MLMGRAHEAAASTLSNRIPLWQECWDYISQKPFTGYGYQGFWTPERTIVISAHQGWVVPHSHNQFIEVSLWVGLLGGAAYALIMLGVTRRAYAWARLAGNPAWAFMTAALAYWTLNMLLEATGLFIDLTSFLLLVLITRVAFPPRRVLRKPPAPSERESAGMSPALAIQSQRVT
jgi:exopolysaccharide production protein ExoQ